jgi:hypothetical protein
MPVLEVWDWSWEDEEASTPHQVAAVPIRGDVGDSAVGAVIVGHPLDGTSAAELQKLVGTGAGRREFASDVLGELPDDAFYYRHSILGSTLAPDRQASLERQLAKPLGGFAGDQPGRFVDVELDGESRRSYARVLPGAADSDRPAVVIVSPASPEPGGRGR